MERDDGKIAERLLYMESEIRSEMENLREILELMNSSWQDPGEEWMAKELRGRISALQEQAAALGHKASELGEAV